jgi:hypothetical protein
MVFSKQGNLTEPQKLGILIVGATILRIIFAQTGLGIDETYTVATSRELHLSVFDHPPLAWWLAWLMQALFHSDSPGIVRLPFIALSAVATWQIHRLTSILFGIRAALFAALAFFCAPALGMTDGTWVLPDGPLLVGLLAATICLARLFFESESQGWIWLEAGFWGGIALLSKYHGIFLFLGTGLFVLSTKHLRYWLCTFWPYLGGLIGLIVFSPVLLWNYKHHWISFAFQGGRASQTQLHIFKPFLTLLGQALFLTPWLWLGLVIIAITALKKNIQDSKCWFLLCLAIPQIVLFTLASVGAASSTFYHWAMPGYLFLLPLLGDWLARLYRSREALIERITCMSVVVSAGLIFCITWIWFSPPEALPDIFGNDPLIAMRPVEGFEAYLNMKGLSDSDITVAPTKWYLAGQFDYALKGRIQVTCFCKDAREYGVVAPLGNMTGRDFIIPMPIKNAAKSGGALDSLFDHVQRLDNFVVMRGNVPLEEFAIFYGTHLKAQPSEME